MKKILNNDQLANVQGGKFWGDACVNGGTALSYGWSQCAYYCTYHIFWVPVHNHTVIADC